MNSTNSSSPNLCNNVWPPGFRFHPTDEELILYYLKRKICRRKLKLDIIAEVDVYKWEPEELPDMSSLKNGDRQWFFFSPRDRKYPNSSRANRATRQGYWKTTGKDRTITCNSRNVGNKKTLVYYRGRAPTGQRTDWVMHEYVLEEDEVKRCQNVLDYFAIYKLFKKSGAGPKNGEQYGAFFREEDWVDDGFVRTTNICDQVDGNQVVGEVSPTDSCSRNMQVDSSFTDIEELLNGIVDDRAQLPANLDDDFDQALSQFLGEEETLSTVLNGSIGDGAFAQPVMTYPLDPQQNNMGSSYSVEQSWDATKVVSIVHPDFVPESTFNEFPELLDLQFPEEDFLEMDDLLGSEPVHAPPADDRFPGDAQLREDDGFNLYYDSDFVVNGFTTNELTSHPAPHLSLLENGSANQPGFYTDSESPFENEMLNFDPYSHIYLSTDRYMGATPSYAPDAAYADVSASATSETKENPNNKQNEASQPSWSSTVWSFAESIPAAPALAAESAFVNKAFLRMSSFSRIRITSKSIVTPSAGRSPQSVKAGVGGRMKGFFAFSLLAALFAVLCVFISSHSSFFEKLYCGMDS